MHFKTLVTVNMPTVEEDPHENAAVVNPSNCCRPEKMIWLRTLWRN